MGKKKDDFTFGESMSIVPIKLSSRDREAVALVAIKAAAIIVDFIICGSWESRFVSGPCVRL